MNVATQWARELVGKCPEAPALTLAKRLYREHPEVYRNVEHARSTVRNMLGVNGEEKRKIVKDKSLFRKPRQPGQVFDQLPEAKRIFDTEWEAVRIGGARRALVLQDVHIPFHDPAAIEVALAEGKRRDIDTIVLNGDIGDFYAVSDWERDPAHRNFKLELERIEQFLGYLRKRFPKAEIVWKDGNHEERYWRYLRVKAPELWGIPQFSLKSLLYLQEHRVRYVGEMRPLLLGKLFLLHGHEYRFPISNPVNPARGLFLRAKTLAACGHFHASSQHSSRDLSEKIISCWSMGCLCDLHPTYRPLNEWGHGFGVVEVDKGGAFHMDNKRIIDGRAF